MNLLVWMMFGVICATVLQRAISSQKVATRVGRDALLLAVIITVNLMSALDATSTVYLVANNHSREINPVMNALIERSYVLFFGVKVALTFIATLVCWHYYERKRRARTILRLTSHVYSALMLWHCLLLSSVLF